ncbi:MAG: transposase [Fimbriimonadaceae bacterium]|nr:transposase [Fimbriimonadaceae bacterium]
MSAKLRRTFSREFKLDICRRIARGETRIVHVVREHGLCRSVVERWREVYAVQGEDAFADGDQAGEHQAERSLRAAEARIASLEAALGHAALELDLLRRAVEKGGSRPRSGASGSATR